MTLRQLARSSGLSAAHLSRVIKGEKAVSGDAAGRIAIALALPADYFPEYRLAEVIKWSRPNHLFGTSLYREFVGLERSQPPRPVKRTELRAATFPRPGLPERESEAAQRRTAPLRGDSAPSALASVGRGRRPGTHTRPGRALPRRRLVAPVVPSARACAPRTGCSSDAGSGIDRDPSARNRTRCLSTCSCAAMSYGSARWDGGGGAPVSGVHRTRFGHIGPAHARSGLVAGLGRSLPSALLTLARQLG